MKHLLLHSVIILNSIILLFSHVSVTVLVIHMVWLAIRPLMFYVVVISYIFKTKSTIELRPKCKSKKFQ